MKHYGIDAIPISHINLDDWRNNFKGIQFLHKKTNLLLFGAIDDLWLNKKGEYIVIDYKATSTSDKITKLDKDWHDSYKRQMEFYQWLLKNNGLKVSPTGYFVYCNGDSDREAFDGKLEFDIVIIPHKGSTNWVEKTLQDIHRCLTLDMIPKASKECDYCSYRKAVEKILQ